MIEKLCDERHDRINESLLRIEGKVDKLIWKFLAFAIALMVLMLAGLKLIA